MNVLLDTCALIALASGKLPGKAAKSLERAERAILPAVVPWEVATKTSKGKLALPLPPQAWCGELARRHRLSPMDLSASLLCSAAALPAVHRDPFDRVIVAAALRHDALVLTSDRTIPLYPGVAAVWK